MRRYAELHHWTWHDPVEGYHNDPRNSRHFPRCITLVPRLEVYWPAPVGRTHNHWPKRSVRRLRGIKVLKRNLRRMMYVPCVDTATRP